MSTRRQKLPTPIEKAELSCLAFNVRWQYSANSHMESDLHVVTETSDKYLTCFERLISEFFINDKSNQR